MKNGPPMIQKIFFQVLFVAFAFTILTLPAHAIEEFVCYPGIYSDKEQEKCDQTIDYQAYKGVVIVDVWCSITKDGTRYRGKDLNCSSPNTVIHCTEEGNQCGCKANFIPVPKHYKVRMKIQCDG